MRLTGARIAIDFTRSERADLAIYNGRIRFGSGPGPEIDLSGCLILPGLVNAHDHLEFNIFPKLGRGPYRNAAEWAADIYRPNEPPVKDLLEIAKPVRLFWGAMKNLASGVTTVSHHNPYDPSVFGGDFPVRVVRRYNWAHSLEFSPNLDSRFRDAPRAWPFIIHAAEGTDARSRDEIARLDKLGVLKRRSVLVHAVAADADALALIRKRGASLVWCPSSNLFLFGRTLDSRLVRSDLPIALGTDSAMTADGDLIDELRAARQATGLEPERLYRMVTTDAARVLRLRNGEGTIREGGIADVLIVPDRGQTPAAAVMESRPELVIVGGRIRLLSMALANRCPVPGIETWRPFEMEGRGTWLTPLGLKPVSSLNGSLRVGGKRVRF